MLVKFVDFLDKLRRHFVRRFSVRVRFGFHFGLRLRLCFVGGRRHRCGFRFGGSFDIIDRPGLGFWFRFGGGSRI
jgi:hypothetical protein